MKSEKHLGIFSVFYFRDVCIFRDNCIFFEFLGHIKKKRPKFDTNGEEQKKMQEKDKFQNNLSVIEKNGGHAFIDGQMDKNANVKVIANSGITNAPNIIIGDGAKVTVTSNNNMTDASDMIVGNGANVTLTSNGGGVNASGIIVGNGARVVVMTGSSKEVKQEIERIKKEAKQRAFERQRK